MTDEDRDRPQEQPPRDEAEDKDPDDRSSSDRDPEDPAPDGEAEDQEPKITLDRYLSRRRPPVRSPTMQIVSLLMMLTALIMIFAFKNRCGLAVADFFDEVDPSGQAVPASRPASEKP